MILAKTPGLRLLQPGYYHLGSRMDRYRRSSTGIEDFQYLLSRERLKKLLWRSESVEGSNSLTTVPTTFLEFMRNPRGPKNIKAELQLVTVEIIIEVFEGRKYTENRLFVFDIPFFEVEWFCHVHGSPYDGSLRSLIQ